MAKKYKLRRPVGVPADVVGGEMERIHAERGEITPAVVVEEARPEDAPLHGAGFTWDDDLAAEKCRLIEARNLIRAVHVVDEETGEDRGCAFAHVTVVDDEDGKRGAYLPVATVVAAPELLRIAIRELAEKQTEATKALEDLEGEARRLGKRKQASGLARARKSTENAASELTALM